jgi:hypothetical protein
MLALILVEVYAKMLPGGAALSVMLTTSYETWQGETLWPFVRR